MSTLSTHVLDTMRGLPAEGIDVRLEVQQPSGWALVGASKTNADGRASDLLPRGASLNPGIYRMRFETGPYFTRLEVACFYPYVEVVFEVSRGPSHHHIPLLLSPFGYSTYRGS